jgi:hypothetical protein
LTASVSQTILDGLTDIAMPRLPSEPPPTEFVTALGFSIPLRRRRALVVGSGAAGLRAAVEAKRRSVDVCRSRSTVSAACFVIRRITMKSAAPRAAARALRV